MTNINETIRYIVKLKLKAYNQEGVMLECDINRPLNESNKYECLIHPKDIDKLVN